jgi:DNA primase catalytic core
LGSIKISGALGTGQVKTYNKDHLAAESSAHTYFEDGGKSLGQWFGKLAVDFGLHGAVTKEPLERLADGQHPFTGEQLVQWRKAPTEPEWIRKKPAWSKHLIEQYTRAIEAGTDILAAQSLSPQQKLPKFAAKLDPVELTERQKILVEIHEKATALYRENLMSSAGVKAREYLAQRGITPASIKDFRLGLSITHPETTAMGLKGGKTLYSELGGYGEELMLASGLFKRGHDGSLYETFQDRLLFPIQDRAGNTIAFGGRKLREDDWGPKYLNSPETELFQKGDSLYNLHRAAKATRRAGKVNVVEGYLDVIASHQVGVRNVVAGLGTALTESQATLLKQTASSAVLNYDSDTAGQEATRRAIDLLLRTGTSAQVLTLSGGKDAAEYLQNGGGAFYAWAAHNNTVGAVEWLTNDAQRGINRDDVLFRADVAKRVTQSLEAAAPELRAQLARELASHLGLPAPETKFPEKHAEHIAARDFTFAPHKSITAAALVGGDHRLVEAHEASVRVAMTAAELYTQARLTLNGTANTENLVAALFTHDTARPVGGVPDPHLHTHVVVFNMTDHDGKIRAVQPAEWYRIQKYLDAIYQAEMAWRVQELGYTLERNRETRYAAIAGYSEEYLQSISRRTELIEDRKEELGVFGAKADQIIALQTREAKVDWSPAQVRDFHRQQAFEHALDPDVIPTAAKLTPARTLEPMGAHAALTFAKHTLIERNAVFDQYELMTEALRYGLGHLRLQHVEKALEGRIGEFVPVSHYRAHAPGERYTTPEMLQLEKDVMETVSTGRNAAQPLAPDITKDDFRAAYSERLNNAQMRLAYNVLTCPDRVFAIQGGAGTGKTTALAPIRELIEQRGYEVYGVAPTSRAASELAEAGIANAQTLQRYLARKPEAGAKPRVLVVDESSLASTVQIHRLLATLRPEDRAVLAGDIRQHQSVEAGRIFEQLQQSGMSTFHLNKIMRQKDSPELLLAIKEFSKGNVKNGLALMEDQGRIHEYRSQNERYAAFADRFALSPGNTTGVAPDNQSVSELNAVVRSRLRTEGYLAETGFTAQTLRNRQNLTAESKQYAWSYDVGDVLRYSKRNAIGVNPGDYAIVEAIDRDTNQLSVKVGDRSLTYCPKDVGGVQVFRTEEREFAVGDRVQFTQPWRAKRIDNRDFAEITALDEYGNARLKLDKTGHRTVSFNLHDMPHLDYGYVVTSYAIQGASRENILVHVAAEDTRTKPLVDKIFANVALSRAKTDCIIFTDSKEELGPTLERLHLKPKAHSYEQITEYAKEHTAAA